MEQFFASGRAVDVVLAVLAIEAIWLIARKHHSVLDTLLMLVPAALILLALRCALTGASWEWIAGLLAASFPVHMADLARRRAQQSRS